jgi:hypothetical protein
MSTPPSITVSDSSPDEYLILAHCLREASRDCDYLKLINLLAQYVGPEKIHVRVYVHGPTGNLGLLDGNIQLWPADPPGAPSREATLQEMADLLREATRQ